MAGRPPHEIVLEPATGYQFEDAEADCYAIPSTPVAPAIPVTPVVSPAPVPAVDVTDVLSADDPAPATVITEVLAEDDPTTGELASTGSDGVAITLGAALLLALSGLSLTAIRRRATR